MTLQILSLSQTFTAQFITDYENYSYWLLIETVYKREADSAFLLKAK